ncbi:MAG: hypothetical protein GC205_07085 [Bacteroidetes bacterium]|nr:hypothetical protein [Bacteroidota bacterium]
MKLQGKYNKLTNKHAEAVAAGNDVKAQNLKDRIINLVKDNWKEMADCPPPVLPPSWCPPPGDDMGKRDGKKGRVGPGSSVVSGILTGLDTVTVEVFIRNASPIETEIVALELRSVAPVPSGMRLLDTLLPGILIPVLGPGGDVLVPVRVELSGPLPLGTSLHIVGQVVGPDGPWPDSISQTLSIADVTIIPLTPIAEIPPTGSVSMTWRVFNPNPFPILKDYTFVMVPDPMGYTELNNGTPYPITNSYAADKSVMGGSVLIPASGFVDITKEHVSNEICEPTMLGCCALEIDGGLSCIHNPNEAGGPFSPAMTANGLDLHGVASGGFVRVTMNGPTGLFISQVPTFPGQQKEQVIDQLVWDIYNQYLGVPNFPYQAVALDNFIEVFGPAGGIIQFQSLDPGLSFQPPPCEAPGWQHPEILPGDQARLSWIPNPEATSYTVRLIADGGPPQDFPVPSSAASFTTVPLGVGEYVWQIASTCGEFESASSIFSFPDTFQVAPCNQGIPPINLSSQLLATRVKLDWDPVNNTTACQIKGTRIAPPGPTGTQNLFGPEPSTTLVPYALLGAGTTWDWRVRCACNTSPVNGTPFSAFASFTVPVLRQESLFPNLVVYPNPAADYLVLSGRPDHREIILTRLVDLMGKSVLTTSWLDAGPNVPLCMDISGVAPGLYLLELDGHVQQLVDIVR